MGHHPGKTVAHERQDPFLEAAVTSFWLMQDIHSGTKSVESQNLPSFCLISYVTAIWKLGNYMSHAKHSFWGPEKASKQRAYLIFEISPHVAKFQIIHPTNVEKS